VWERQEGLSLDEALNGLRGNLRAYYIQAGVAALRNRASRMEFDLAYEVKGTVSRAAGEVIKGDAVVLSARSSTSGYPYVFNIDTLGVIHPLYPVPGAKHQKMEPGQSLTFGADGTFTVEEPLGREMIVAFLLTRPSDALTALWQKDNIGNLKDSGMAEQNQFLNTLREQLTASDGQPRGKWASRVLVLRSFKR